MAVRLEVSHTYSYSFLTKLAKSLTQKCPERSQLALRKSEVPLSALEQIININNPLFIARTITNAIMFVRIQQTMLMCWYYEVQEILRKVEVVST